MLEKGGSKACASQSRKTIINHDSVHANKIHSATTNCPKQKYNSLYKQVLPTAEGCHKSNQEEMFVSSKQNGSGDLLSSQDPSESKATALLSHEVSQARAEL